MLIQGLNSDGEELSSTYVQHDPVDMYPEGPSLTRQEFADECDINNLMAQYEKTGTISHFNNGQPQYLDLTEMPDDLQTSLELMKEAELSFMRLPALVRKEFDNNPIDFVTYAMDPTNIDQLREWGLAAPKQPAEAFETRAATPEPPPKGEAPEAS
ncbi:internal scaffolding protein [Blackfly microvirus SF02]|uniref:Internal scaffolding protein n=1 Tax=Blackfly microvirus SF02 TaxID=2576452 RepID=A0A4P8PQ12_9VIRU|nr:internal scaffolding protein [Blackfly microvirus SF02]